MFAFELTAVAKLANDVLVWIGFGTIVGLLAKAIMPGRDPGGPLITVLMGVAGSVVGCGTLMVLADGIRVSPISPVGFVVATAGALFLLAFYHLLAGRFSPGGKPGTARTPRQRRTVSVTEQ